MKPLAAAPVVNLSLAPALPAASAQFSCDVLVIGGGPAGSTISALLAAEGRDVVLLEKARHPRFHIGESLLPANVALLEKLGVRDQVERIGLRKWGVEFVSPDHAQHAFVEFADAWDKTMPYAWQVRRSAFDEILFRNAAAKGARTFEAHRVRAVAFDADGATVQVDAAASHAGPEFSDTLRVQQTWRTRFVVDASGRDTLLANHFNSKRKNPQHNSAALYGHFTGATRLEGRLEGNISILWFDHGWFWVIPLADGTTSVGAVCWPYYLKSRRKPLADFFAATIALCPELQRRLVGAELVDHAVHATGNYSYTSTHSSGPRHLLLGDAYAFIDPVFSSGVYLAMQSGFDGAEVVRATLDAPASAAAARARVRARVHFDRRLRHGPRQFAWFIYRVTNPTLREFFMAPLNPLRVKEALLSLLAGDIFGTTPIWGRVRVLKALYWLVSLGNLRRTWRAWQRRRGNIRDAGVAS